MEELPDMVLLEDGGASLQISKGLWGIFSRGGR